MECARNKNSVSPRTVCHQDSLGMAQPLGYILEESAHGPVAVHLQKF